MKEEYKKYLEYPTFILKSIIQNLSKNENRECNFNKRLLCKLLKFEILIMQETTSSHKFRSIKIWWAEIHSIYVLYVTSRAALVSQPNFTIF